MKGLRKCDCVVHPLLPPFPYPGSRPDDHKLPHGKCWKTARFLFALVSAAAGDTRQNAGLRERSRREFRITVIAGRRRYAASIGVLHNTSGKRFKVTRAFQDRTVD